MEARIVEAELLLQIEQFDRLTFIEIRHPAELLRQQQNSAVGVEDLGLPICLFNGLADRHRAVVGEDDRVDSIGQEWNHRVSEGVATGSLIRRDRHFTHEDFNLGEDALRDRFASHRERRGMRRMAVNDRLHVRPMFHDGQVQQDLAGPLPLAGDLRPFHIDRTDVVGRHETLADHRGRTKHFVLAHANRDVPIVRRREALVVDATSDLADVFFELPIVDPGVPLAGHLSFLALPFRFGAWPTARVR